MGRRRMSGGMGGRGICRTLCWKGKDVESYEHPDWAQAIEKGGTTTGW